VKENKALNQQTVMGAFGPPGMVSAASVCDMPVQVGGGNAQSYQPYGKMPERKPVAVAGVGGLGSGTVNDKSSSLVVGERSGGALASARSSISLDSRPGDVDLARREEELMERERIIEEMERERRAEELGARERAVAEREREINAWNERRASGNIP